MVMELAFSIDRDGLVQDTHAVVYKQLGDWVRACYGTPVASTSGKGINEFSIFIPEGSTIDRLQLREDTIVGQRVRNYTITTATASAGAREWVQLAVGSAIGTKRILLLGKNLTATGGAIEIKLKIDHAVAPPSIRQFAAFAPCADSNE
jgi:hypothetical protein